MTPPLTIHRKRTHHRSRNVVMLPEDFEVFSELLEKEFPDARYYMNPTDKQRNYLYRPEKGLLRTKPPRVLIHHSLHRIWQCALRWGAHITMVPDTEWKPVWKNVKDLYGIPYEYPYWSLNPPRHPYVWLRDVRHLDSSKEIARPCTVDISVHCQAGNKAHLRFASLVMRLLGRIASDRDLVEVEKNSGKIVEIHVDMTSWHWVGHAARRWATDNENCYLGSSTDTAGIPKVVLPLPPDYKTKLKQARLQSVDSASEKTAAARRRRMSYRTSRIALVEKDIAQFSALLAEEFPQARYYMQPTDRQCNNPYRGSRDNPLRTQPPRLLMHGTLYRIWQVSQRWKQHEIWMVADPQWEPVWEHRPHYLKDSPPYWSLAEPSLPFAKFEYMGHSHPVLNGAITTLYEYSYVATQSQSASKEFPRFESRFFGALDKVARDFNMIEVKYPSGEIVKSFADDYTWRLVGDAARRWAAEDSTRFLSFTGLSGLRPLPLNSPEA
jgi:hypothetical protein